MKTGITQTLTVQEVVANGWMVGDDDDSAFLGKRNAPDVVRIGDELDVFIYNDKDGSRLATVHTPFAQLGEFAMLEVIDVSRHGLHLDWGLDRDLFVPFSLQHERLSEGDRVVVVIDLDDQGRLFGSNKLHDFFDMNLDPLTEGQEVSLLVYGFNSVGALVVVDGRYTGIVYKSETFQTIRLGDELTGYIKTRRHDGKLDVTLQRTKRAGTLDAVDTVWDRLQQKGGYLPLTDKSDPDRIRRELAMSKKQFKKAVGALYKQRRILLEDRGIRVAPIEEQD